MSISTFNIKKWYRMLSGKSILHVNQGLGRCFSTTDICGYYNDLTEKVTKMPELLNCDELPHVEDERGEQILFPVAVFQYGLGTYDLYLLKHDERYLKKFYQCVCWAMQNQESSGAWNNFFFIYPRTPYGAMCQGEGASLLIRAYKHSGNKVYLEAAQKALDFMLISVTNGGTSDETEERLILLEYTHRTAVLNGWIFALFGLYDAALVCDSRVYRDAFDKSLHTLIKSLHDFDCGYWSIYSRDGKIASPFYHDLHIAQMQALYAMTHNKLFLECSERWTAYKKNFWKSKKAFVKKVFQKIRE